MRFPVLVKWLDCAERLSLQVHPPKELAGSLKGEPKTENWYVAHTWADSGLFVGLKLGTTKENFLKALLENLNLYVTVFRQVLEILYLLKAVACTQSMGQSYLRNSTEF